VVIGFEPNRHMHPDLERTAAEHTIELDLRATGVERMDLPDASQDAVVSSFTLCSVENIDTALAEIRRVLKPGGRFLFVEHIAADHGTAMARAQTLFRRPWAMIADRCNLMAQTQVAMDRAGFSHVDSTIRGFGPKLDPSRRTLYGIATK
jgi:ubiquinone/menaquinone biosynthesis C-methylase UbiE